VRGLSRLVQQAKGLLAAEGAKVQQRCRSRLRTARRAAQALHRQLRRKGEEKEAEQQRLYTTLVETTEQMVQQATQVVAHLRQATTVAQRLGQRTEALRQRLVARAQGLYAFSGGQDEKDLPVLTKTDISQGTQTLLSQVKAIINDQAQAELKPGFLLLPLKCSPMITTNHQPGEHVATAIITINESCTPLVYEASKTTSVSQHVFKIPRGFHMVSFSVLVLTSNTTPTGGIITVHAIAYLKRDVQIRQPYRFAGK
jgi:hypothetical protein